MDSGKTIDEITEDMKYYDYYYESYQAALGGFIGNYSIEVENSDGTTSFQDKYGIKAFLPIAKIILLAIMMILVLLGLMVLREHT